MLLEFFVAVTAEAFGDIIHDGAAGSSYLVFEGEVVGEGGFEAVLEDDLREGSCLLPGFDVFEAFHRGLWVLSLLFIRQSEA